MFRGCKKLPVAPNLSAPTLAKECYSQMFMGCEALRLVTCFATDMSAQDCLKNWLSGAKSSGIFQKKSGVSWPSGESGIPTGWTPQEI